MAFADEKLAALEIIKAFSCDRVDYVDAILLSYDDVFRVFVNFIGKMGCFPDYMYNLIACFDIIELNNRGIYYNDPALADVGDAVLIIKCVAATITVTIPPGDVAPIVVIAGASIVDEVIVTGGGSISILAVIAGALVKYVNTTAGSWIEAANITGCRNHISGINTIDGDADVRIIDSVGGGYFGGFNCAVPTGMCADEVTLLVATNVTHNSITLTWTNAVNTINTVVYYRLNNSAIWLLGNQITDNGVTGEYIVDAVGFIFRGLQGNTYYDFKVVNICSNGHPSPGSEITQVTTATFS